MYYEDRFTALSDYTTIKYDTEFSSKGRITLL